MTKQANRAAIPQLVEIARLSAAGTLTLKRRERRYLGSDAGPFYLSTDSEVLISATKAGNVSPAQVTGKRLLLPEDVQRRLAIQEGSPVALIEREGCLALKKMVVQEKEGAHAYAEDFESPTQLTRVAVTNPPPERLLPALQKKFARKKLRHDAGRFLRGRRSLAAWQARALLGRPDDDDAELRQQLIRQRLDAQEKNGSWCKEVTSTARALRELAELGVSARKVEVRRGAEWLLKRAKSPVNLGMFFLTDELVQHQKECLKPGRRFRDHSKPREIELCAKGDDLFKGCCGQRILWPNAIALEALIALGYEEHPRVQQAIRTTLLNGWCECAGQHGLRDEKGRVPPPDTIDEWVAKAIADAATWAQNEYTYGGVGGGAGGFCWVDPNTRWPDLARISHRTVRGKDAYLLRMPFYVGPCEVVTLRAFAGLKDRRLRSRGEAQLGRIVGRQQPDGTINPQDFPRAFHSAPAMCLRVFAAFERPIARAGIMRSVPWIVKAQNRDGSWGEEPRKDATTLAVLRALVSGRDYLPAGLSP